jgi:hypothetical protein
MASTIAAGTTSTTALVYTADTSGILQLQTNGTTTAATFDTNQNMGLGVTPSGWTGGPAEQFKYYGSVWNNSDSSFHISENAYFNGSWNYINGSSASATNYYQSTGTHNWRYAPAGTGSLTWTTAMTLDNNGNLGLGVTPSAWASGYTSLQIGQKGNSITSYGAGSNVLITSNCYYNVNWNYGLGTSTAASSYTQAGGVHQWAIAPPGTGTFTPTLAMTLDNSGNLLVGTTSTLGGTLSVTTGSVSWAGWFQQRQGSGSSVLLVEYSASAPNNSTDYFGLFRDNAAQRIQLRSNGGIGNYSGNNVNLSDETMKKDITPAKSYLSILNQIPVVTFLFNDQIDTETNLGVTAQSVQAVAPELVGTMDVGTKEEPNIKLAIYETDLKYAMLKAIQELSAQVTTLQSQVAALTPKA